ncbi:hypothetical protein [Stenotrophomonas sp. PS02289]|uniref:hypothetical protein n=1 Tax=Stenotrophomonas sp. PS02289 TaxID=2991422 RepID=UPI00249B40D9|nr:hypothetical protein [Stenotrophomonas sp. PS02289]
MKYRIVHRKTVRRDSPHVAKRTPQDLVLTPGQAVDLSPSEELVAAGGTPGAVVMYWDGGERAITPREKTLIEEHRPSCFNIPLVVAPAGLDQESSPLSARQEIPHV